jgi:hypothetical protein
VVLQRRDDDGVDDCDGVGAADYSGVARRHARRRVEHGGRGWVDGGVDDGWRLTTWQDS